MIGLVIAAFVTFASTPEQAAMNSLYTDNGAKMVTKRVNVVGKYATVLIQGGKMEGSIVTSPILVEHFSFGWQPLEILNFRSRLVAHRIGRSDERLLMRGMQPLIDDAPCSGACTDAGQPPDVEVVRKQMRGPLVPYVVVSGEWALGEWYGGGGGESLFKKTDGRWHLIKSGGGEMDAGILKAYGVPDSAMCPFGVAKCPTSHASTSHSPLR